jgi:hypothetical protein
VLLVGGSRRSYFCEAIQPWNSSWTLKKGYFAELMTAFHIWKKT